jgi:2-desacetyl-2-hydroxyethyl bacteriochlorophyllide A dehydrogenase
MPFLQRKKIVEAIVFTAPETIEIKQVADPICGSEDVIVQVARVGICGTDLHIYRNDYLSRFPIIPGHEFGGVIVEVGQKVTDFRCGDRVAVDPNLYCGHCYFCRNQQANHCLNWQAVGVTRDGAFADYVAVPARACYLLPNNLTDTQAAFIEPLSCVVHALNRLRVAAGDEVLIFGAGPTGLLLLQALHHSGASQVVVVEPLPDRLALARQLGATTTISTDIEQSEVLNKLAPYGFDIVVDATGVPAVIEQAFSYLKPRGQYLQFGVAPINASINLRPYDIFRHDWTIIGSFALCYTFQPAIAWLANGIIDVAPLVSQTVPLTEFATVFQKFADGQTLKVHLQPTPKAG